MSTARVAVGAVVVHDGALLLVQRAIDPEAGKWAIPGGHVEYGETVRDAVAREVLEETGVTVAVGDFAGWDELVRPDLRFHIVFVDFFATVVGAAEPRAGDDAAAARWVPIGEVARYDLVENLLPWLVAVGTVPA
jgi:acetyl-CoA carboxylase carboxyl transferase subunit beta